MNLSGVDSHAPDVTDHVLGVPQMIQDTCKNSWNAAERETRCGALYGGGLRILSLLGLADPATSSRIVGKSYNFFGAGNICSVTP